MPYDKRAWSTAAYGTAQVTNINMRDRTHLPHSQQVSWPRSSQGPPAGGQLVVSWWSAGGQLGSVAITSVPQDDVSLFCLKAITSHQQRPPHQHHPSPVLTPGVSVLSSCAAAANISA
jgi:hypothetical protein